MRGKSEHEMLTRIRCRRATMYDVATIGTRMSMTCPVGTGSNVSSELRYAALSHPVLINDDLPSGATSHSFTTRFTSSPLSTAILINASGDPLISTSDCCGALVKVRDARSS